MAFIRKTLQFCGLLIALWVAGFAWFAVLTLTMQPQKPTQTTDAIVVLTGGDKRIETGLALFAAGRAEHLFISGVHPSVTKSEIKNMWNGAEPLPDCCITLGHSATTTVENASETQAWIREQDYNSIRLITANYHMARALLELRHTLPDTEIIMNPITQPDLTIKDRHFWELIFSEYHKVLFRRLSFIFLSIESALS